MHQQIDKHHNKLELRHQLARDEHIAWRTYLVLLGICVLHDSRKIRAIGLKTDGPEACLSADS
jgi:hypothetical protein